MVPNPLYSSRLVIALVLALALPLALDACGPRLDTRGNLPDPDRVSEIQVGRHGRGEVEAILGSPSSAASFDTSWYYISKRTETLAFFAPKVSERSVIIVRFDAQGKVSEIEHRGLEDGKSVELVERTTPTAGNELTIFDQILGNFGRFSKPESSP